MANKTEAQWLEAQLAEIETSLDSLKRVKCHDRVKVMLQASAKFASVLATYPAAKSTSTASRVREKAKRVFNSFASKCIK
jgi:hypothetical protein